MNHEFGESDVQCRAPAMQNPHIGAFCIAGTLHRDLNFVLFFNNPDYRGFTVHHSVHGAIRHILLMLGVWRGPAAHHCIQEQAHNSHELTIKLLSSKSAVSVA